MSLVTPAWLLNFMCLYQGEVKIIFFIMRVITRYENFTSTRNKKGGLYNPPFERKTKT
jgi:hypothetical protein